MLSRHQVSSQVFLNMADGREPLPSPSVASTHSGRFRDDRSSAQETASEHHSEDENHSPVDGGISPPPRAVMQCCLMPSTIERSASVIEEAHPEPSSVSGGSAASGEGKKRLRFPKVRLPAMKKLTMKQIWQFTLEWLSNPVNFAAFVWCILATGAFLVLIWVELGFAKYLITSVPVQESVKEDATQILNALFVLMCLVWHPVFIRDVVLLVRWKAKDKWEIRAEYCKGGKRKPHDRTHMSIVVFWLHITCFATYAYAILYWVYPMNHRPTVGVLVTMVISFVAPALAFLHILFSPLGKDYDIVREGESTSGRVKMFEKSQTFFQSRKKVRDAQWEGTVCPGCCADRKVAWLSCFCPFCMFGYNMERLGFGNRYMHMIMFVIVLVSPILIFFLCSTIIADEISRIIVYYTGIVVAVLGLTYGGAWRIKMRVTYKLPAYRWACGNAGLTDLCLWLLCPCCSLCQEMRTADQYDIAMESSKKKPRSKSFRGGDVEQGTGGNEEVDSGAPVSVEETEEEAHGEDDEEEEGEVDGEYHGEDDVEEGTVEEGPPSREPPKQFSMRK